MTLADLYRKALEELAVVAAGEPAYSGDLAVVAGKYTAVYDMLTSLRLVTWTASGDVPEFAVLPLTSMLAFATARDFGKDAGKFADGALGLPQPALAERQLRQQMARDYVSTPQATEYF